MEDITGKILEYNTERETLLMPEYGRNVLKMIEDMKKIEDRDKRTAQARAIIKVMELLNPQVRAQENYVHKLWDHLYIISGFELDVDSPFAPPVAAEFATKPVPVPMKGTRIKATHYGRNIEKIIDLIIGEPEGEIKNALIHSLATYMRQQYLIWNKDSVADETIFADIVKLSEGRISIPEGMTLDKISFDGSFSKPGMAPGIGQIPSKKRNRRGFKPKRK